MRDVFLIIAAIVAIGATAASPVVIKPRASKCTVSPDAEGCSPAVTTPPADKCTVSPDAAGCSPAVTKPRIDACTLSADRSCQEGYVWRMAGPDDFVCVAPEWARRARRDNADAEGNADGANGCLGDLGWREAFLGDVVCVTREVRLMTRDQNRDPDRHRVCR